MDVQQLIQWVFQGLVSFIFMYGVNVLREMKNEMKEAKNEISKTNQEIAILNAKVGQIFEKSLWHEKIIEKHDERITRIEQKD